ncbi:MAG: MFS transporter, partial [Dehalococcoidia bacterium]
SRYFASKHDVLCRAAPDRLLKLAPSFKQAAYPLVILRQRNYALLWSSTTIVAMGTQMEAMVLSWFVYSLTGSAFLTGSIAAARMSLNVLALFSGAIADRLPRHRLLAGVEFTMASLGILMLLLILLGRLEVWHIFAITVTAGLVRIFQMPAAQSLVADTLAEDRISNGAALNTVGMNMAVIGGPIAGGVLLRAFDAPGAYTAIAALYWLSGIFALSIRVSGSRVIPRRESVLRTVLEGLRYVRGQQVLWATLLVAVVINLTGWPFHQVLLTVFAKDELGTDAAGLGLLQTGFGIGALSGSIAWSLVRNIRQAGKLMILSIIAWHATMLVFALSSIYFVSLAILIATGMAFSSTQVLMLTVMLRSTQQEYRGRVVGLRVLAINAFTFGSMGAGGIAGLWGAPWAAVTIGSLGIGLTVLLVSFTPKLLRA